MSETELLRMENITKSFDSPSEGADLQVLKQIDLSLKTGESLAIIGPSGSGKSTLLNIIGGLIAPTSGKILLAGRDMAVLSERELASLRVHDIGFIFQLHHLLPQCTVLENVLLPTLAYKQKSPPEAYERGLQLLQEFGLNDRLQHYPGQLSGGERQRVAVARALINQPKLLLADEPTGALDRSAAEKLVDLLVDLNQSKGVTLIMVTHSEKLASRMHRLLVLSDGKLKDLEGRP